MYKLVRGLVVGLLFIFVVLLVDIITSEPTYGTGVVIEKIFSPSESHTGIGVGVNSNGNNVVTHTSLYKPDEYLVFIQTVDGPVKAKTIMKRYLELKKDDEVKLAYNVGGISGIQYSITVE